MYIIKGKSYTETEAKQRCKELAPDNPDVILIYDGRYVFEMKASDVWEL